VSQKAIVGIFPRAASLMGCKQTRQYKAKIKNLYKRNAQKATSLGNIYMPKMTIYRHKF